MLNASPPNAYSENLARQQARPPQQTPQQIVDGLSDEELLALQSALIEEYREKHPELNEFELYIAAEVNQLLDSARRNGVFIPPQDAIEFGIEQFKKKFKKAIQSEQKKLAETEPAPMPFPEAAAVPQKNPATPQNKEVNRLALNMDLGGSPASVAKLSPDDIWNMPREQFLALDRKIRNQHHR